MPLSANVVAALGRMSSFYSSAGYDPTNNPGGLAAGGHRINFTPSLVDIALVVSAIGDLQDLLTASQQVLDGLSGLNSNALTAGQRTALENYISNFINGLPKTDSGLAVGKLWNNGGTITRVEA